MIKDSVVKALSDSLGTNILLLTPKEVAHGDYAFHISQVKGLESAEDIIKKIEKNKLFDRVELVGSFINLFISTEVLTEEMITILDKQATYGQGKAKTPLRINLEFGQPNTHKLPHIGHLFSYIYGESLTRLLEFTENQVYRTNYQGDVGLHVAKCLYQVRILHSQIKTLKTLEEKAQFLQKCYQKGSKLYEGNQTAKKEIDDLNKKIYGKDPVIMPLWEQTRQWSIEYYKDFEKFLGTTYNRYYFESETSELGTKLVEGNIGKVFERSDGAVVFKGEKYGLHTRVFITSHDTPTYEAKDIGLISLKYKESAFDKAIITTASEQIPYWQVVKKAIELIFPNLEGKITHIGFGMIDLKGGKMSSRTGNIISAFDLVQSVIETVAKMVNTENKTPGEVKIIAHHVALSAIKYSFLQSEATKSKVFDIDQSVATTGNSGPYLLYTYARTQSVLSKATPTVIPVKTGIHTNRSLVEPGMTKKLQPEELALLRSLFKFPEVVHDAAGSYTPHLLCTYLFDIAQKYSIFYENCPILKADEKEKLFRLMLTKAVGQVLKNGLDLLGIETLDHI